MKTGTLIGTFVLGAACALVTTQAISQDGGMPSPDEMKKMMEEWKALMEPGSQHAQLDYFVGSWNTTTKMWWGGPGSQAMTTAGTAEFSWILDKHFLKQAMQSKMVLPDMETGGMEEVPYSGLGVTGYDNHRKMYSSLWASSLGTEMLTMKGGASPDGKVFTYYGEMDEPMLGVVGRYVKYVSRILDEDTFVFEIVDLHAGDDYKVIEVTYERSE